jgi:hypothetical protein
MVRSQSRLCSARFLDGALQSLSLLNSEFVHLRARAFAKRVMGSRPSGRFSLQTTKSAESD